MCAKLLQSCLTIFNQLIYLIYLIEHLFCFYFLAILNNLAVSICVFNTRFCVNVFLFSSFRYISKIEIAGSYGNFSLKIFEELSNCFPKWLNHFTFPTGNVEEEFLHVLNNTCIFYLLLLLLCIIAFLVDVNFGFDLHFPSD